MPIPINSANISFDLFFKKPAAFARTRFPLSPLPSS